MPMRPPLCWRSPRPIPRRSTGFAPCGATFASPGNLKVPPGATPKDDEAKLAMFRTAMAVARRDKEKRLAFDVLAQIPSVETLELAVSYLQQPAIKECCGRRDRQDRREARRQPSEGRRGAMRKLIKANIGGDTGKDAKELLDRAAAAKK